MSGTQRKGSRSAVVEVRTTSRSAVAAGLSSRSMEVTSEEERVLRGLHGVSAPADTRLERKASGPVLDELLVMELEIRRRYQAHLARARPVASAEKDQIVRALRAKK